MKQLLKESLIIEEMRNPDEDQWTGFMTINDFSDIMSDFYDKINEVEKYLDDDTIKHLIHAKKLLNMAWHNEANAHGVTFEEYPLLVASSRNRK